MDELRKIQLHELDILNAVVDLCQRHHLRYWLAYGTLLGAVRHKGFIPWDDDMDIYMTVSDLRKFVRIAKKELQDNYFVQCPLTERKTSWLFCKVRKNGTRLLQNDEPIRDDYHQGIWIDVFPLVSISDNVKIQDAQIKLFMKLQRLRCRHPHYSKEKSIKELLKRFYNAGLTIGEYFLWKINILLGSVFKSSNYVSVGVAYNDWFPERLRKKERLFISKEMMSQTKQYEFEQKSFISIEDYNKYLTQMYGADYMTPKKYGVHADKYENCIIP